MYVISIYFDNIETKKNQYNKITNTNTIQTRHGKMFTHIICKTNGMDCFSVLFLSQCYQNILISHTSSVFMIYVRKNEWCSGKPKAVRVGPNNNDSEVAKQPKRRITLDIGHRTFGAQSLWLFHLTHHLDKIHLKSLVLYFDKITCN